MQRGAETVDVDDATWWVYVLISGCGRKTYVGSSTDVDRRLRQHNGELRGGARMTRMCRPWRLARVVGPIRGRCHAQRVEAMLKRARGLARVTFDVHEHVEKM